MERLSRVMGDKVAMQFESIGFRHKIPRPKWYNPLNKRKGAGIYLSKMVMLFEMEYLFESNYFVQWSDLCLNRCDGPANKPSGKP